MPTLTIYPLGNADTTRIDLDNGKKLLIDYADRRSASDPSDKRIDLPTALRADLRASGRRGYDAVAFTHLDDDHVQGASDFFYFEHAKKYQSDNRATIGELWVPAAVVMETNLTGTDRVIQDKRAIRQEARHRLKQGHGVRVFSSPGVLNAWLLANGIGPDDARRGLITDAGNTIPGFDLRTDGVEFFVHSPFATRSEGRRLDRNNDALALHATFLAGGRLTRALFLADLDYDVIRDIVGVTEYHGRTIPSRLDRLRWDVHHVSHHSSYNALGPDKGVNQTEPDANVKRLFETYGQDGGIIVSTSKPIPTNDDDIQPPHRQAANYYRAVAKASTGQYVVTMEHPTRARPAPLVITIGGGGATVKRNIPVSVPPIVSSPAPRAG